jgi:hypothetical protein
MIPKSHFGNLALVSGVNMATVGAELESFCSVTSIAGATMIKTL